MTKLAKLIKKQVGNGGKKYWQYAGFPHRVEWCGAFVYWCIKKCGGYRYMTAKENPFYVPNIESWAKKNGRIIKKSKARQGDIITFDWDRNGTGNHVGFFWSGNPTGTFVSIEGNTGGGDGRVMMRTRYASQVNCVIRLQKTSDSDKTTETGKVSKTKENPVKTESVTSEYMVLPKVGMNVRASYTQNSKVVGTIAHGKTFTVTMKRGNWVYSPKHKGWVCVKGKTETYLKKVK